MYAAVLNYPKILKTLLANGANVNARDNDKWTALDRAKVYDHKQIIRLLKKAGAAENPPK